MSSVAVIGLGTMGTAISEQLQPHYDVNSMSRGHGELASVADADIAIIAVKPQSYAELVIELQPHITDRQLVISIMAGVAVQTLISTLGTERVARTMPNLALTTGNSMTAFHTNQYDDRSTVKDIVDLWGSSIYLEDESQFDAFTALAGSGPAYFFELARSLEQAAVAQGFDAVQARAISMQTFIGAASMVGASDSPADWVRRVASKGGTTEAALRVFKEKSYDDTIYSAVEAARLRSYGLR